jgi:hypothetical protein
MNYKQVFAVLYPVFLFLIINSGCKTAYVPNTLNTPLLKEKGEFKANVDENNLQLAYAVTNRIAVMANGFYKRDINTHIDSQQKGIGWLCEGGLGYYNHMKHNFVFETFAGAGFGNLKFEDLNTAGSSVNIKSYSVHGTKVFVQPGFG